MRRPRDPQGRIRISPAEADLLARLVHAEAGGEPFEGQVAVAASVLNRVRSPLYPDTVRDVIYQVSGGYYQYAPVLNGRIRLPASPSARMAVLQALRGKDPSLGATGFYNPSLTRDRWVRSQPVTARIGDHVFFGTQNREAERPDPAETGRGPARNGMLYRDHSGKE